MSTRKRILQFADYKGFGEGRKGKSFRSFSIEIDVSHVYFTKEGSMGSDVLEKISAKYPELNMDWVINGRGEMIIDPAQISEPGGEQKKFMVNDFNEMVSHELLENKAMMRVVLRMMAEVSAMSKLSKVEDSIKDANADVEAEISEVLDEWKQRYS